MYFLQYTVIEHSAKESLGGGETPDTCRQRDAFVTGRPCEAQAGTECQAAKDGRQLTNLLIKRSRQPPAHTLPRGAWWDAPPAGRSIGRRRREPTGNNPRCTGWFAVSAARGPNLLTGRAGVARAAPLRVACGAACDLVDGRSNCSRGTRARQAHARRSVGAIKRHLLPACFVQAARVRSLRLRLAAPRTEVPFAGDTRP